MTLKNLMLMNCKGVWIVWHLNSLYEVEPPEQLLPERLNSIGYDVWQTFWRQLTVYCGTIRGAMGIPISYVFRAHDYPTDEMLIEAYADSDEELIATVELEGPDYLHDNKMVWIILTRLVGSGACWPFIQHLASTFDARAAIKILKTQSEGTASDASRRARANGILDVTIYDGKSNKFSFDKFIEKLQSAFTELEETKNGISEGLKVDRMIKNITSPLLHQAIPTVINDVSMHANFSKAAAFLSGYLAQVHGIDPTGKTSKIASTTTDTTQVSGGRKYTDEEWKLLPSSEKEAIRHKRQKQKQKEKRKAAAVANGGLEKSNESLEFADEHVIAEHASEVQAAIVGLTETNLDWQHRDIRNKCRQIFQKYCNRVSMSTSSWNLRFDRPYQPGGTTTVVGSPWAGRVKVTSDTRGLGRWSISTLTGRQDSTVSIITAYRATGTIQKGPFTAYSQQLCLLREKDITITPEELFYKDLGILISNLTANKSSVILMMDANDSMQKTKSKLTRWTKEHELLDPHTYLYGIDHQRQESSRSMDTTKAITERCSSISI
jgi:hypothetical protein